MICYEIVNPSDQATFLAPDREIALAVVSLLGEGWYAGKPLARGAAALSDDEVARFEVPIFIGDGSYESWWQRRGYPGDPLAKTLSDRGPEVAVALRSVAYCGLEDRRTYDAACAAITDSEKLAEFQRSHEDRRRSSLNAIVKRAWAWADSIEKMEAA